jgi:hypothetical protein
MGFDVYDKKMYKKLKSFKKTANLFEQIQKDNEDANEIYTQWEQDLNNKIRHVTGNRKVKEAYTLSENIQKIENI